ncbi:MAG: 6-carboxytetrahydropterin synthase [Bacteroidota bacterium]|nr:6-carboxytetrahydropterin synthase [Bacteroidota bacterium]
MPTVYVTRRARFNAAHRLHNDERSGAWNQATFGACNSPNWHGHNYTLDVTVAGEPDPETGYVLDLAQLSRLIEDHVVRHLDHKNLNLDVPFMQDIIPSTENLVVAIWDRLANVLPAGRLHRVYLEETEKNSAEYFGPNS